MCVMKSGYIPTYPSPAPNLSTCSKAGARALRASWSVKLSSDLRRCTSAFCASSLAARAARNCAPRLAASCSARTRCAVACSSRERSTHTSPCNATVPSSAPRVSLLVQGWYAAERGANEKLPGGGVHWRMAGGHVSGCEVGARAPGGSMPSNILGMGSFVVLSTTGTVFVPACPGLAASMISARTSSGRQKSSHTSSICEAM
eukprot:713249-Pleurochrysis_carterae.AAC.1